MIQSLVSPIYLPLSGTIGAAIPAAKWVRHVLRQANLANAAGGIQLPARRTGQRHCSTVRWGAYRGVHRQPSQPGGSKREPARKRDAYYLTDRNLRVPLRR